MQNSAKLYGEYLVLTYQLFRFQKFTRAEYEGLLYRTTDLELIRNIISSSSPIPKVAFEFMG